MAVKFSSGGDEPGTNVVPLDTVLGVQGGSHMTIVRSGKVSKQDKQVLSGSDIEKDDAFEAFFFNPKKANDPNAQLLRPPYDPKQLSSLSQKNNSLGQMVAAMEVNIDGTGSVIEKAAPDEEDDPLSEDPEKERIEQWFKEPFPRTSFMTLRRETRRDLEIYGYAYMEVLRALDGTLMFLKRIPANQIRLVKLDEAVQVEQTLKRDGEDMKILMNVRERRYVQKQGTKMVYFKEYAGSRELDRDSGEWAEGTLPAEKRATEILEFKIYEDVNSAYGVPRWINQIPSVLGSRKAEELNLDFFNSGGLPPALVLIQGGELTTEVRKQLQQYMSGRGSSFHRAGIVEVAATGGSIDSPGNVRVTVERFGSERMSDSMFEKYDERCEMRVRSSFRLPPIFVGKADDYSFATAFASYTVTEAQVFRPERDEFDEIINNTIMRELDPEGVYVYRSLPLTVQDINNQLEALGFVKEDLSKEGRIEAVNEITGMSLKPNEFEEKDPNEEPEIPPIIANLAPPGTPAPGTPAPGAPAPQPVVPPSRVQAMDTFDMMELVAQWCRGQMTNELSEADVEIMRQQIIRLSDDERQKFDGYCTMRMMSAIDHDLMGAVELLGAASSIPEHADDRQH
jgi:PBSX family phage portal protein